MSKKLVISESEKDSIRKMYGLINEQAENPVCNGGGCSGSYTGPEFQNNSDVAHQYSNTITKAVANKLKELYKSGTYVKVDFSGIKLSTKGMGSGNVVYTVTIPFISVSDKCQASTGFAHVGGWNHTPELENRKNEILSYKPDGINNVVVGNQLDISPLTRTKEGLQEYWIQWKHSDYQSDCKGNQQQTQGQQTNDTISVTASDLKSFGENIAIKTSNQSLDISSIKINVDNKTFSINKGNTPVLKLVLRWNIPNEPKCESCESTINKNTEYGAKQLSGGTFENNTRIYSLIGLFPQK